MSNTAVMTDAPAGAQHDIPSTYFPGREDVVDWQERFKREDDQFQVGEKVAANVTVVCAPGAPPELHVVSQGCAKDIFVPESITADDITAFGEVSQQTGIALVTIVDVGDQIHVGHRYVVRDIELTLTPVNPTPDKIVAMPDGMPVTIEGTLMGVYDSKWSYGRFEGYKQSFAIRGTNGINYVIWSQLGIMVFADGVYENLSGKTVMIGEKIRLNVGASGMNVPVLDGGYAHAYLLEPSASRRDEYEALRRQVDYRLDRLGEMVEKGHYQQSRNMFAIIHNMELTEHEREHLYEVINNLDWLERPIYQETKLKYRHATQAMRKAYNAEVETMCKRQFRDFADRVAHGEVAMNEDADSRAIDSVISLIEESPLFNDKERTGYAIDVIEATLQKVAQGDCDQDELRQLNWALRVAILRLVDETGKVDTPDQIYNYLLTLGDRAIENGYFGRQNRRDSEPPLENMMEAVIEAMRFVFVNDAASDNYARALEASPLLRSWHEELEKAGYRKYQLTQLRSLIILRPDIFNY